MEPECSNYHRGSGLCIIAKGHPHQLHRVLNNAEVKERNSTNSIQYIYIYIYMYEYMYINANETTIYNCSEHRVISER